MSKLSRVVRSKVCPVLTQQTIKREFVNGFCLRFKTCDVDLEVREIYFINQCKNSCLHPC